jgi:hypothetical protein
MEPSRRRPVLLQFILLLMVYPVAVVAVMRIATAYVQSAWMNGVIFIVFTLLFLRIATGLRSRRFLGRRW